LTTFFDEKGPTMSSILLGGQLRRNGTGTGLTEAEVIFGGSGDEKFAGDFNGDGITDLGTRLNF